MTKSDFIKLVAEKAGLTQKDAAAAVGAIIETITDTVAKEPIQLIGFGTFSVAERAGREGFNPITKEKITIPASKTIKFKPGKALKDAIN